MASMTISASEESSKHDSSRPGNQTSRRSRPAADEGAVLSTRFFLPKPGMSGNALELGREFSTEGEARVEALKLAVTYFSVQEWRPVADFAGKNPELKREAVSRKGTG